LHGKVIELFGPSNGGRRGGLHAGRPFLGRLPIDPSIATLADAGAPSKSTRPPNIAPVAAKLAAS
jgi:hypothetical protein